MIKPSVDRAVACRTDDHISIRGMLEQSRKGRIKHSLTIGNLLLFILYTGFIKASTAFQHHCRLGELGFSFEVVSAVNRTRP